jgi:hypothetical protein
MLFKNCAVALVFLLGFLFLAVVAVPSGFVRAAEAESYSVDVYVVCLDGVSVSGVENVSRVVEGVLEAAEVDAISYMADWSYYEVGADAHVYVVTDWVAYRLLVEFGSNLTIINAHGEVLPVPSGYAKEEWVDKIAFAMACRSVTWAHTAGYPFSKVFYQESGIEEEWGVDGFKRLMSHINRGDAVCSNPIPPGPKAGRTGEADGQLLTSYVGMPFSVDIGMPLNGSYFEDYIALSLYEYNYDETPYCSGAILKFAGSNVTYDFGFYIQLSWGSETYGSNFSGKDVDAGYVAGAAAMWENVMKAMALNAIREAEQAVENAKNEGRTSGLNEAIDMLNKAKSNALQCNWVGSYHYSAIPPAWYAKIYAEQAYTPNFLEAYGLHLTILGIIGATFVGSFAIRRRNNRQKD